MMGHLCPRQDACSGTPVPGLTVGYMRDDSEPTDHQPVVSPGQSYGTAPTVTVCKTVGSGGRATPLHRADLQVGGPGRALVTVIVTKTPRNEPNVVRQAKTEWPRRPRPA
jgi:hypothetical protein